MLNRQQFLELPDRATVKVDLPGGDCVYVRTITAEERDRWEKSNFKLNKRGVPQSRRTPDTYARFAALVTSDENGVRLFTDADVDLLNKKSAPILSAIYDAGRALNFPDDSGDTDELAKN